MKNLLSEYESGKNAFRKIVEGAENDDLTNSTI